MSDDPSSKASNPDSFLCKLIKNYTHNSWTNFFFGTLVLFLVPFLTVFAQAFDEIVQKRKSANPSYNWPEYSDLYVALLSCMVIISCNMGIKLCLIQSVKEVVSPKYVGLARDETARKMIDNFIKAVYVCFSSGFAYYVAKDASFFPRSLGGSGSASEMFTGFPYQEPLPLLRTYLMIQLGYHMHNMVMLVCNKPKADFMEFFLHHVLTVSLMGLAYFMNYVNISLLVLLAHDLSDIFVHSSRLIADTAKSPLYPFCGLLIAYAYLRFYVFPAEIIAHGIYWNPVYHDIPGIELMALMLHLLLMLHVYWYCLIVRIGLRFIQTNKFEEHQES